METRDSTIVTRGALAIVWLGMAGFVGFHSFLLLSRRFGDPAVASFRIAWFVGLGFVVTILIYFSVRVHSTADDGSIVNEGSTPSED